MIHLRWKSAWRCHYMQLPTWNMNQLYMKKSSVEACQFKALENWANEDLNWNSWKKKRRKLVLRKGVWRGRTHGAHVRLHEMIMVVVMSWLVITSSHYTNPYDHVWMSRGFQHLWSPLDLVLFWWLWLIHVATVWYLLDGLLDDPPPWLQVFSLSPPHFMNPNVQKSKPH